MTGTTDTGKPPLIVNVADYNAAVPDDVPWAAYPLAYFGGVTLLAGIWKGGKSTLMAQLQRAREQGGEFLGATVNWGPTLLVTEEGGFPVKRKTNGMTELYVLDKRAAGLNGLDFTELIPQIRKWCMRQALTIIAEGGNSDDHPPMIFIDTLAVWGDIADENDASEMTLVVGVLADLAQATGAAVILVHHVRKEGGAHGRGIRGSSAIASTVDTFAVMDYTESGPPTNRSLKLEGRMIDPIELTLSYDPEKGYSLATNKVDLDDLEKWIAKVPPDGEGYSVATLINLWGISRATAQRRIEKIMDAGRFREDFRATGRSGTKANIYWSIPPAVNTGQRGYETPD